jgi:hypothetical protein
MSIQTESAASNQYDSEGNAKHYTDQRLNSLVMIERTWGTYEAMVFCEITAFKYRYRLGKKPGQPLDQELIKSSWYEKKAKELQAKIGTDEEVKHIREVPYVAIVDANQGVLNFKSPLTVLSFDRLTEELSSMGFSISPEIHKDQDISEVYYKTNSNLKSKLTIYKDGSWSLDGVTANFLRGNDIMYKEAIDDIKKHFKMI